MRVSIEPNADGGYDVVTLTDCAISYMDGHIRIPAGFRSDGASVPRWLWWAVNPKDFAPEPSVAHDFLYTWGLGERLDADRWYLGALLQHGYGLLLSLVVYVCVRIFGGSHWRTP